MERVETNWTAVTGAPSSGKTTLFHALESRGALCRQETATIVIETRLALGEALQDICGDQVALQHAILEKGLQRADEIDPSERWYLDRTVVDTIAYCKLYGMDEAYFIEHAARHRFRRVFQLDRLPFTPNHVRIESEKTAALLDRYYQEAYEGLGYEVVRVPVMPVDERAAFILEQS